MGTAYIVSFLCWNSLKKISNFAWQNKWRLVHNGKQEWKVFWYQRLRKNVMIDTMRNMIQKLSIFLCNYCGKSRNFTTINKWMQIWTEPIILKWNFVLCRRKIACKLWLKIWSLLWCTAIRNGGQIFFCSICSCTKIGASHTKTVEITSEKIESTVRNSITLNACNYHENQENTKLHSELKFPITFGYWFWHLIVRNRSIALNFYQQRPVFAWKKLSNATKAKNVNT